MGSHRTEAWVFPEFRHRRYDRVAGKPSGQSGASRMAELARRWRSAALASPKVREEPKVHGERGLEKRSGAVVEGDSLM